MVLLCMVMLLPSCTMVRRTPMTIHALKNTEYFSEWSSSGVVKLTDGIYRENSVPGSATKLIIMLSNQYAFGDLNSDGNDDAAVVLISDPGGSGTFFYLAAVINRSGTPGHVATEFLGDRIKVKTVTIQSGEIVIEMVTHDSGDPMPSPTKNITRKYILQGDRFIQNKLLQSH